MSKLVNVFEEHFSEPDLIRTSLAPELNVLGMHNSGEVARKTNKFVFYSHDNKFVIRSLSQREFKIFTKSCKPL